MKLLLERGEGLECTLQDLRPGERAVFRIGLRIPGLPHLKFSEVRIFAGWGAYADGPAELRPEDNQRSLEVVFCGDNATSEGCKTAK